MQLNTDSKIISTALLLVFTVAFTAAFNGQQAQAAGFGSRKKPVAQATPEVVEQSVPQPVAPSQAPSQVAQTPQTVPTLSEPQFQAPVAIQAPRTRVSRKTLTPEPPSADNVEWIRVPFDKAENEVLMLFQRDLAKLEDQTSELAIYEVRTSGRLPKDYQA